MAGGADADGLKKLEYLSLVSKLCTELESHLGFGPKELAEFIIELGKNCETVDEFDRKLKVNGGVEMPDFFVRTLFTIIRAILPSEPELYMVYKGRVSRVMETGCFVQLNDFKGKEGLVHVTQMATRRIGNVKVAVKRDQEVFVKVISMSGQKLSLSMRDVDQHTGKDLLPLNKSSDEDARTRTGLSEIRIVDEEDAPSNCFWCDGFEGLSVSDATQGRGSSR